MTMMDSVLKSLIGASTLAAMTLGSATMAAAPKPYGATPNEAQLKWADMEMYAFVHFTLNTFTGREWGGGEESPNLFNPTEYDVDQIVSTLAKAGFKGVVLTCKHHDGFCMWPTETTYHSIASSPWKNGQGDVVKDFAEACKKYGIKFGVYLSPWDRNHETYGTPEYVKVYRKQLEELLSKYGDVFIVWHDGASGGDGFYGGKRESRVVDKIKYYDWPTTWKLAKKLAPNAVIFSDVGPDVRWVGNESGFAGYPHWATFTPEGLNGQPPAPGAMDHHKSVSGTQNGKYWIPAEVDVSIRPGWFWHAHENSRVRTPENLMQLYMNSVGRGANLNLNVPPDTRGRIHENDVASLQEFSRLLKQMYSKNFAEGAKVTSSSTEGETAANNVLDRKRQTFWMAKEGDQHPELTLKLPEIRTFDVIRLAEPIQLGQRIVQFTVEVKKDGAWAKWIEGSTVGTRVILQGPEVSTDEIRIIFNKSDAPVALSEVSLWMKPKILSVPTMERSANGKVTLKGNGDTVLRYTTDGSEPTAQSKEYSGPIDLEQGGTVNARAFLKDQASAVVSNTYPMSTQGWKVVKAEDSASSPDFLIDGNERTLWNTHTPQGELAPPQAVEIDMGKEIAVKSIFYTPRQDGIAKGTADKYEVYLSKNGKDWGKPVAQGEFSNIKANPIRQRIDLAQPVKAQYMKFVVTSVVDAKHVTIAELGVVADK